MALKSYDWKGNLIHDFGGNQYRYLDYMGGGYFAAMWRTGFPNMDTYGIIKITNGSVHTVRTLTASLSILGTVKGGVVHDGHHFYVAREAKTTRPSILYKRYLEKYDWKGNVIFKKEIHSTGFLVTNKSHCIELDTNRIIYATNGGLVKSISPNNFTLGQSVYRLAVIANYSELLDICMTKHRIITTNLDSGANAKGVIVWDKTKTANKIINFFPIAYTSGISTGVTTDGRVIYVGI